MSVKLDSSALSEFYTVAPADLTPVIAYQLYVSIKLDFSQQKYDYHRDLIITKAGQESLDARNDKSFFYQTADKFLYQNRYIPLLASNLYLNPKIWIKNLMSNDSIMNALAFRKYMNNVLGSFETDLQKLKYNSSIKLVDELYHPVYNTNYFTLLDSKSIHPITGAILNHLYYGRIENTEWNQDSYINKSHYLSKLLKYIDSEKFSLNDSYLNLIKVVEDIIND
jgi:hypothetical protein